MSQKSIAMVIAGLIAVLGILLVVERGGGFGWSGGVIGIALLVKVYARPSRFDLKISISIAAILSVICAGTLYLVRSTWESGEVVELRVDLPTGVHIARVWVLNIDESIVVYYDAEPDIVATLISDPQISVIREGELIGFSNVQVRPTEIVPVAEVNQIFQMWEEKYGRRTQASVVYSLMFGRSRDKEAMILTLTQ